MRGSDIVPSKNVGPQRKATNGDLLFRVSRKLLIEGTKTKCTSQRYTNSLEASPVGLVSNLFVRRCGETWLSM